MLNRDYEMAFSENHEKELGLGSCLQLSRGSQW